MGAGCWGLGRLFGGGGRNNALIMQAACAKTPNSSLTMRLLMENAGTRSHFSDTLPPPTAAAEGRSILSKLFAHPRNFCSFTVQADCWPAAGSRYPLHTTTITESFGKAKRDGARGRAEGKSFEFDVSSLFPQLPRYFF